MTVLFVLPILFLSTVPHAAADPGWWDANWGYRAPVTLTTHENVPENYQYRIIFAYSHALDNWQDIRFLEDEDSGELDYWIENYTDDNVTAWVKRAENDLSDNTLWIYWGNASAGPAEDVVAVWDADVGFDSADGWTENDDAGDLLIDTTDSRLEWTNYGDQDDFVYHDRGVVPAFNYWTYDFTIHFTTSANSWGVAPGVDSVLYRWQAGSPLRDDEIYSYAYQTGGGVKSWTCAAMLNEAFSSDSGGAFATGTTYYGTLQKRASDNVWFRYWTNSGREGMPTLELSVFTNIPSNVRYWMAINNVNTGSATGANGWIDTVLLRQFVDPEPTASVGVEESSPGVSPKTYDLDVGSTVDDDCVLYLNFDENSGQTENRVYDSSGENNHGTMENFQFENDDTGWTVGYRGTALIFDGENDYVSCDNDDSLNFGTGDFSLEAWFKTSDDTPSGRNIIGSYASDWSKAYALEVFSGKFVFFTYDDLSGDTGDARSPNEGEYNDNVWHHVVGVRSNNIVYLYVDGELIDDDAEPNPIDVTHTDNFTLGYHPADNGYTVGSIDEVRVYDRALSAEEVENHYFKNWLALTDLTPRISWSYYDADGDPCENIQIQVGTTPGGGDMWLYYENSCSTFIDYAGATLTLGENYYVRARSHDGTNWGDATDNLQFRVILTPPVPSPLYPTTFTWTENEAVESYDIQIDDDSDFGSLMIQDNDLADNSYTYTFTENGVYYWRVRAIAINNLKSAWSSARTVWVNTPHTAPSNLGVIGIAIALVAVALAARRARKSEPRRLSRS